VKRSISCIPKQLQVVRMPPNSETGRIQALNRRFKSEDIQTQPPRPQNERQREMREQFFAAERVFESQVDYSKLSSEELRIHQAHREAIDNLHFTYDDPQTGLKVITRLRHFLKGTCCGNACRHCVYQHQNVDPVLAKKRLFNSAFWIDDPNYEERKTL